MADTEGFEDEEGDSDDGGEEFTINTSDLPEAEAALQLLGALAKFCAGSFARYLGPALEACRARVDDRLQWTQVGIRKATVRTLGILAETAFRFTHSANADEVTAWTPGLPVSYEVEDAARQVRHKQEKQWRVVAREGAGCTCPPAGFCFLRRPSRCSQLTCFPQFLPLHRSFTMSWAWKFSCCKRKQTSASSARCAAPCLSPLWLPLWLPPPLWQL